VWLKKLLLLLQVPREFLGQMRLVEEESIT